MNEKQTAVEKRGAINAVARKIDEIAGAAMVAFKGAGSFAEELEVARAISDMRALLTPEIMAPVMALMDTDLGFRTDSDPKVWNDKKGKNNTSYSVDVVREVFIESRLRGFHSVGNEFNIISGRFYAAKNGFQRKVQNWPGVSGFQDWYEVPRVVGDKGAIVKCRAVWTIGGVQHSAEREFPIKVNAYMGSDAILGKCTRKLLKVVHDRLAGVSTPDAEVGDMDPPPENEKRAKAGPAPTFEEVKTSGTAKAPGTDEAGGGADLASDAVPAESGLSAQPVPNESSQTNGIKGKPEAHAAAIADAAPASPRSDGPPTPDHQASVGAQKARTIQDDLADAVLAVPGAKYIHLHTVAVALGWYTEKQAQNWQSFDDISDQVARRLHGARASLVGKIEEAVAMEAK